MNLRPLHHALLIALLGAAPFAVAHAAGAKGSDTHDTTTASAASTAKHGASMPHKSMHPSTSAARSTQAGAARSAGGSGDRQYESALRRCVEMTGDGRERCLDDAIARHGS